MLQSCWLKCWLIWALSHNRYLLFLSLLTPEDYRQTFLCTRLKHWSRAKKARLVWLRKLQDVRQITCLKQQRSLSFIFCKTQRSYEKIMCICYFIGSVVKIVLYLHFFTQRTTDFDRLKRNRNDGKIVFLTSLLIALT